MCEVRSLWRVFKIYWSIYNLSFWDSEYKNIIKEMHNWKLEKDKERLSQTKEEKMPSES